MTKSNTKSNTESKMCNCPSCNEFLDGLFLIVCAEMAGNEDVVQGAVQALNADGSADYTIKLLEELILNSDIANPKEADLAGAMISLVIRLKPTVSKPVLH